MILLSDRVRRHGYELFVTLLVLALGCVSFSLRSGGGEAPAVAVSAPAASPQPAAVPAAEAKLLLRPVSGGILTPYADSSPVWNGGMGCWQTHAAVDFAASEGEPVLAADDGAVADVRRDPLLGLTVVLTHSGDAESVYASLSSADCRIGQIVRRGEIIGTAGNSADGEAVMGCHLHFELLRGGLPARPVFAP